MGELSAGILGAKGWFEGLCSSGVFCRRMGCLLAEGWGFGARVQVSLMFCWVGFSIVQLCGFVECGLVVVGYLVPGVCKGVAWACFVGFAGMFMLDALFR